MNEEKKPFEYTYSAKRREEVERIRRKYTDEKSETLDDKLEEVRRLDRRTTDRACAVSLALGILSALTLGLGMSLIMSELGASLGPILEAVLGVVLGLVGLAGVFSAYPVYERVLSREKKKVAPRILELTEELRGGE